MNKLILMIMLIALSGCASVTPPTKWEVLAIAPTELGKQPFVWINGSPKVLTINSTYQGWRVSSVAYTNVTFTNGVKSYVVPLSERGYVWRRSPSAN